MLEFTKQTRKNISFSSLTNFKANRLRGPRAGVPPAGQGRVLSEEDVPLLLIKLTYLHMQIRHVHLHFRNNIVLLMSFVLGPGQHLCQCKYVDKYLLDSTGAFKPSSQR